MNRMADDDLSPLGLGMIRIGVNACHRIHEDGERFLERDAVLREVGDSLRRVPLEYNPAPMLPQEAYHGVASHNPRGSNAR